MIECEVYDPYDSPGSVLAESQCIKVSTFIVAKKKDSTIFEKEIYDKYIFIFQQTMTMYYVLRLANINILY